VSGDTVRARADAAKRVLALFTVLAAWACYAPLGAKYATVLTCALAAGAALIAGTRPTPVRQAPALTASLALPALLAVSALWSPAPVADIGSHLWLYTLPLLVPIVGSACSAQVARRALAHFVVASAAVGVLFVLAAAAWLPPSALWSHTTTDAEGNQRIATSILLALGAALAGWLLLQARGRARGGWALAGAACVAGLALQDRRSGMLLLPVVLLAWALARQQGLWRRLLVTLAIVAAAALAWQLSSGVRARFDEGVREVQQFRADDTVATSWGQRLRMWQVTAGMVAERPLLGHGVASWKTLWRQRVTPGTALYEHTTPHSEYLLLAQQAGVAGAGVLLWLLAAALRRAVAAGPAGVPALLAWSSLACLGLFNAVLRDAKFALPLLLLAAMGTALARRDPDD
jgi:O-antigen ligase